MKVSVALCLATLFVYSSVAQDLFFKNSCSFTLWAEARGEGNSLIPGESDPIKIIETGHTVSWTMPDEGLASTRFWAKYGCDEYGANCAIGDQIPNTDLYPTTGCPTNGCTPPIDSLFEATWGCKLGTECGSASQITWFDTSQVDGWTLPYKVTITGDTECDCTEEGCTDLEVIDGSGLDLAYCPQNEDLSNDGAYSANAGQDLRYIVGGVTVGCMSPCKRLTLPSIQQGLGYGEGTAQAELFCCPTPNPGPGCLEASGCVTAEECREGPIEDTLYVQTVHSLTSLVYAYAYDDLVGLHTCPAADVQYTMEFCPEGSPTYPYIPSTTSGTSSTATTSSSTTSASSTTSVSGTTSGLSTSTGLGGSGCTSVCGSGLLCCNSEFNGEQCYSSSEYVCTINDNNQYVLCQLGYNACGQACYNPAVYTCVGGSLELL